jgi:hypothetical protein
VPAYIAWDYFLYEGLNPPPAETSAELSFSGKLHNATRCKIKDIKVEKNALSFTRLDDILPILPPGPLPPRKYVPLEKLAKQLWAGQNSEQIGKTSFRFEIRLQTR